MYLGKIVESRRARASLRAYAARLHGGAPPGDSGAIAGAGIPPSRAETLRRRAPVARHTTDRLSLPHALPRGVRAVSGSRARAAGASVCSGKPDRLSSRQSTRPVEGEQRRRSPTTTCGLWLPTPTTSCVIRCCRGSRRRAASTPAMPSRCLFHSSTSSWSRTRSRSPRGNSGSSVPAAAAAVPDLVEMVRRPAANSDPRFASLWALERIGGAARGAVPAMLDVLRDEPDSDLRMMAARTRCDRRCGQQRDLGPRHRPRR